MIDKQYIMGYQISNNGYITTSENAPEYLQEEATKNRTVDKIFEVILNPKNQINLSMPITTDRMQELASKSKLGKDAQLMNPYNPASKYLMQIQNMVGKKVIGNVATAIKSFFALSNVYNEAFTQIYNSILEGNYDRVNELLNKYTFNYNGKLITLANVNLDLFNNLMVQNQFGEFVLDPNIPEDIRTKLETIIQFQESLDDQSMILGELEVKWLVTLWSAGSSLEL